MTLRSRTKLVPAKLKPAPNAGLMLFVAEQSLGCDWVRLVLCEKDVEGAQVNRILPGWPNEDFLVLNPSQTLPTLADREGVLTGARVIAEYLDERYPHPPLMLPGPAGRARVRMAMQSLEQELFPLADRLLDEDTDNVALAAAELSERVRLAARLFPAQGPFLGREYTLADSAWCVLLRRLQRLRHPLSRRQAGRLPSG